MSSPDAFFDEIIKLKIQLRDLILQHFIYRELFSWVWWFGIVCIAIVSIIWWKLVDKKRLLEICTHGLIVIILSSSLDVLGSEMVLWEYRINILIPNSMLIPIDFIILPVINMIIYQKCPKWGKYMIVCTITAAFLSFVLEPFAIWIGNYMLISWKLVYSFPIYILINVLAKLVTKGLISKQKISRTAT